MRKILVLFFILSFCFSDMSYSQDFDQKNYEQRIEKILERNPDLTREDIEQMREMKQQNPDLSRREIMRAVKGDAFADRMQKKFEKRMENVSPQEREKIQERIEKWNAMSSEERQQLKQKMKRFKNMDPDKRERLRQKFESMTPEERKEFKERKRNQYQKRQNMTEDRRELNESRKKNYFEKSKGSKKYQR